MRIFQKIKNSKWCYYYKKQKSQKYSMKSLQHTLQSCLWANQGLNSIDMPKSEAFGYRNGVLGEKDSE